MHKVKVIDEQWDYLIILDACRYDYFEQVWRDYLQGSLEKRISIGSSTPEWRSKSFTGYYGDVIYISSNPYINSLLPVKGFSAKDHFCRIYDVWHDGWDKEKQTVLPETVTYRAIDIIKNQPDKRAVIHYMQPHEPYLGEAVKDLSWHNPEPLAKRILSKMDERQPRASFTDKIMRMLADIFYKMGLRGHLSLWRVRKFLKMPPMSHMDAVRRKYGKEGLRRAYKENLEIALKHVAKLVEALSGRIVVTADHGEVLGEGGCYCHWDGSSDKFLLEVPWLVIDKGNRITGPVDKASEEEQKGRVMVPGVEEVEEETKREIREKLRTLGYID